MGTSAFTFHVLGESHLVSIQRNGEIYWQELLSCRKLSHKGLLHHRHFTRMGNHSWQHKQEGIDYQINVQFSEKPIYEAQPRNYLEIAFPMVFGNEPYTRVQWQLDAISQANRESNRVRWQTVHTYPHPAGVTHVITESIIHVK
jgi:hypothetical protein